MEIKDNKLTINIPEGMEIDIQNSNLKAGVIKFKKKEIDYLDVCTSLGSDTKLLPITTTNCEKVKAIDKLIDIANYYNKGWKPNWNDYEENKYYIRFRSNTNENDYDIEDDILIQRTITDQGKSSMKINNQPATLSFVRQIVSLRTCNCH